MIKWTSLLFCLFLYSGTCAQDSTTVLTFDEFMQIVKKHHPISFQSQLLDELVEGNERMAKGGFDPKLEGDWIHKSFDDKNYYSIFSGAVKIPTWFGIELKAGYDNNRGSFLNESDIIPNSGLWNAGISVPLGKGFIIDQRRAALKKAELFALSSVQEQRLILNQLFYDASSTYLQWQVNERKLEIAQEGLNLATNKFVGTRKSFEQGDKPAIDTLESFIAIQSRTQTLIQAQQNLENSRIAIENFLWMNGSTPLELEDSAQATPFSNKLLSEPVQQVFPIQNELIKNHPTLIQYDLKIKDLEIDRKLQAEDIKPEIRLDYNPLINTEMNSLAGNLDINNYKLGATATYSILQRKARGKVQMTDVKIKDTAYDLEQKKQALKIKLRTYQNNILNTSNQIIIVDNNFENYARMLLAENQKLVAGESSIFLVNSREQKYLDAAYKVLSVNSKLIKHRIAYLYTLAYLSSSF